MVEISIIIAGFILLIGILIVITQRNKDKEDKEDKEIAAKLNELSQQNKELARKIELEAQNDLLNTQFVYAPYNYGGYGGGWGGRYRGHRHGHHKK